MRSGADASEGVGIHLGLPIRSMAMRIGEFQAVVQVCAARTLFTSAIARLIVRLQPTSAVERSIEYRFGSAARAVPTPCSRHAGRFGRTESCSPCAHRTCQTILRRSITAGVTGVLFVLLACSSSTDGPSPTNCSDSKACHLLGWCGPVGSLCRAQNDAHCLGAPICAEAGQCTEIKGLCWATSVHDCLVSSSCQKNGSCFLHLKQCFVPADHPEGCIRCQQSGECTVSNGACIAVNDADCLGSSNCVWLSLCSAIAGRCLKQGDSLARARQAARFE